MEGGGGGEVVEERTFSTTILKSLGRATFRLFLSEASRARARTLFAAMASQRARTARKYLNRARLLDRFRDMTSDMIGAYCKYLGRAYPSSLLKIDTRCPDITEYLSIMNSLSLLPPPLLFFLVK